VSKTAGKPRHPKTCATCGKTFLVHRYRLEVSRFCSQRCMGIGLSRDRGGPRMRLARDRVVRPSVAKVCVVCSVSFSVESRRQHTAQFCSRACLKNPKARLLRRVVTAADGCWNCRGATNDGRYCVVAVNGRKTLAHRAAYELLVGPVPEGLEVCHRCDNTRCVNPEHLFLGTHLDNMRDMVAKGRQVRGERSPNAKLTDADVVDLRARRRAGASIASMARARGLHPSVVSRVCAGKRWAHVRAS
jgi:hypothetical protein